MAQTERPEAVTRAISFPQILERKFIMKRFIASAVIFGVCSIGLVGCAEKESAKKETTVTTPGGTTTIKTETDVKKTGKNPPDAP